MATMILTAFLVMCAFTGCHFATDNCETQQIQMSIIRTLTIPYNGVDRNVVCVANVQVNECDGTCVSHVSPSAYRFPGFDKVCKCCRETTMVTREITLEECRHGNEILPVNPTTLLVEPANCACHSCRN